MEKIRASRTCGTDPWKITESRFNQERIPADETIFATANGYLGMRGAFEDRVPVYHPGTYLNGIYETKPIVYGEHAYGFARLSQTILNVMDAGIIQLYVDDDLFDLSTGKVREYCRSLDMKTGVLERRVLWESPSGKTVYVQVRRIVSFVRHHIAAFEWQCRMIDCEATLTVLTIMNGAVRNLVGFDDPRIGASFREQVLLLNRKKIDGRLGVMRASTRNSGLSVACASLDRIETDNHYSERAETDRHRIIMRYSVYARPGTDVKLERYVAYCSSRDTAVSRLSRRVKTEVRDAEQSGLQKLFSEQAAFLDDFWRRSDIGIEGEPLMTRSIRFNLFHILQGSGTDGKTSVPAKGLTGEGYDGHYFWDSEIYILPIFLYTQPWIARKMLEYRYGTLDAARERARELGHRGALYPWRTINGQEASAYFPAGTAQYHINADIVFAMKKYVEVSGDSSFLRDCAAEVAVETARFWLSLGDWIPGKGFCLNCVTGPDEYSALVNNNVYTNLMARMNMEYAAWALEFLEEEHPEEYARLRDKLEVIQGEADAWRRAAASVSIPFNRELGLYAQDDAFFDRARWSFDSTEEKHPLLLHFHPLNIYRSQVLKQPDLILAQFLLGNCFSLADKKRNFDYYDALITGDSSLAPCIQSVMAAEIFYVEEAYEYFSRTARMDLDDINGNVRDGVHMAAMAGTWISLVYGFAGLRDYNGEISFRPVLPEKWTALSFRLCIRNSLLQVEVRKPLVRYSLLEGEALEFRHGYRKLRLEKGASIGIPQYAVLRAVILDMEGLDEEELNQAELQTFLAELTARGIGSAAVFERNTPPPSLLAGTGTDPAEGSTTGSTVPGCCLDMVLDGSELKKKRPDPEIFLNASESLRELPEHCAVISGSPEGILAAENGRFRVLAVGGDKSGKHAVLPGLKALSVSQLEKLFPEAAAYSKHKETVQL